MMTQYVDEKTWKINTTSLINNSSQYNYIDNYDDEIDDDEIIVVDLFVNRINCNR